MNRSGFHSHLPGWMSRPPFKLYRRQASVGDVAATGVVGHLNVIEQISPGIGPGQVDLLPDPLPPEEFQEALADRALVTVPAPADAADEPFGLRCACPSPPVNLLAWSE